MPHWKSGAGTRWRGPLLHLPLVLIVLSGACAAPESGPISVQIAIHPEATFAKPGYISVSGLNAADLSSLRDRPMTDVEWSSLLKILVGNVGSAPDVLGRYALTDSAITFTPLFPFDPGRPYRVVFDPSRLPRPRQVAPVTAVVQLPAVVKEPTMVVAVHPSADVVPENLLRVYIEFSAPMGNGSGLDFVKLVELSGPGLDAGKSERVETGAFLPVEASFWSPDHTRYTLFFDPGRVKDDILPNREIGRPLRAGRRYAIDIGRSWTDANGLPLKAGHRHTFRVGPAVDEAITLSDWKLALPAAGTRDPLKVRFPRPLDHGILVRALGVETRQQRAIPGGIGLEAHDTGWVFTPVAPWQPGEYNLVAMSFLEDPQGNQIGRAFEAAADEPQHIRAPQSDVAFRVPFTIGRTR